MAISDEQLKQARALAAEIVANHSDFYAPIFEVLDAEIRRREDRLAKITEATQSSTLSRQRELRRKRRRAHLKRDTEIPSLGSTRTC